MGNYRPRSGTEKFIRKGRRLLVLPGILQASLLCLLLYTGPASALEDTYQLHVSKSGKELLIKQGEQVVRRFEISLGKGGKGAKQKLGDNRTPVGVYKITSFKNDSKFHYFMQIDYPNMIDAWYGYKNNIISAAEFKEIAFAFRDRQPPPQDTALGGYIGIHGLGDTTSERLKIHENMNWTEGCIAMKNSEINALRKYVSIGTRVTITE